MPTVTELSTVVRVAALGSMTKAARELHYSVSSISTQITTLSRQLGVTIFERRRTGVVLTAEGRQVVAASCAALCAVDRVAGAPPATRPHASCPAGEKLPCLGFDACAGRPLVLCHPAGTTATTPRRRGGLAS